MEVGQRWYKSRVKLSKQYPVISITSSNNHLSTKPTPLINFIMKFFLALCFLVGSALASGGGYGGQVMNYQSSGYGGGYGGGNNGGGNNGGNNGGNGGGYGSYGGNSYNGGYFYPGPSPYMKTVPNYGDYSVSYYAPGASYTAQPVTYVAPQLTFYPPNVQYADQSVTYSQPYADNYGSSSYSSGY